MYKINQPINKTFYIDVLGKLYLPQEKKEIDANSREAKRIDKENSDFEAINRDDIKVGDTVCVLSSSSDKLFFLARTVAVTAQKLQIHWYGSKKIDSTYTLEYGQKASKGLGPPNLATIWRHTIIYNINTIWYVYILFSTICCL